MIHIQPLNSISRPTSRPIDPEGVKRQLTIDDDAGQHRDHAVEHRPAPLRIAKLQRGDRAEDAHHDERDGDEDGHRQRRFAGMLRNDEAGGQVQDADQQLNEQSAPTAGPKGADDRGHAADHQQHAQQGSHGKGCQHGQVRNDDRGGAASDQQSAQQREPPPVRLHVRELVTHVPRDIRQAPTRPVAVSKSLPMIVVPFLQRDSGTIRPC